MLFGNVARLFTILSTSGIATSVTVGMLIFNRNDKTIVREESQIFENIEIQADEFKKQEYFYSEDGTNDGKVFQITPEEYEKIKEVLEGKRQLVHTQTPSGSEKQTSDAQRGDKPTEENRDSSINIPNFSQQSRNDSEISDANELSKQASTEDLDDDKGKQEDSTDSGKSSTIQSESSLGEARTDKVSLDSADTESRDKDESSLEKSRVARGEELDLSPINQEQKDGDVLPKTKEIQERPDDSSVEDPASVEAGSGSGEGPKNCKPCPKGKKDSQTSEEGKKLDTEDVKKNSTVSQTDDEAQLAKKGEQNDKAPSSDSVEGSRKAGVGVLDEGTISSLLTGEEQLKELEDLYGKIGSVLGQLTSKFGL